MMNLCRTRPFHTVFSKDYKAILNNCMYDMGKIIIRRTNYPPPPPPKHGKVENLPHPKYISMCIYNRTFET